MKAQRILARRRFQTWCVYSESGAGKTSLSATAPSPIFLDSNQGLLSIAERPGLETPRSVDIHTMRDLEDAYLNCIGTGDEDWSKRFQTIIWDHFDDMQGIVLDELVEKAMEKDDRRDDAIEQREYGIMGNKLRRYVRKFKRVPMHKILICGAKSDFETGKLKPSLVGAMGTQLPYLVDHTAFLRINPKTGKRYLHLDPTDEFYAKTRAHWLTPEQRKIRIDFKDTQSLTKLFDLIAAGPKGVSHSGRR